MFTTFDLPHNDCINISNFVYQEKDKWKKDLNNVKSLTSGFRPDYQFLHDIGNYCAENILTKINNKNKWEKSCWWINFYQKGHFAKPHHHDPEEYSLIIIVKPTTNNCLYFVIDNEKHYVEEKEGLAIMFKSNVEHGVDKVNGDRITVAMDFVQIL